jgi:mono/diheme cytochrome c family protein
MALISRNLSSVSETDVRAIATFMVSIARQTAPGEESTAEDMRAFATRRRESLATIIKGPPRKGGALDLGAELYAGLCASCHESTEHGQNSRAQSLTLSTTLHDNQSTNLIHLIVEGLSPKERAD